jgi:exonuclease VII small subunit
MIGQGEDMSKSRMKKYKNSQENLNKALRKVEELLFESADKDKWRGEEAERELLDKAVSMLHEAQSLLVKARLRLKS